MARGNDGFGFAPLREDEVGDRRAAREAARLPARDLARPDVLRLRVGRGARQVGYGALEVHGDDFLRRSSVVIPGSRGEGVGRRIVERLLGHARRQGAERAFLLTTNARACFEALDLTTIDRAQASQAIAASRQAARLRAASATRMTRSLSRKS